jgi:hypothetical protein
MTTEQAYVDGFVKRAAEYGFNESEAMNILKQAVAEMPMASKGKTPTPTRPKVPYRFKDHANDTANPPGKPLVPLTPEEQY